MTDRKDAPTSDNFAHIIATYRDKEARIADMARERDEWVAASEQSPSWICPVLAIATLVFILVMTKGG